MSPSPSAASGDGKNWSETMILTHLFRPAGTGTLQRGVPTVLLGMEAAREFGGFEPVGEEVQFGCGEAEGGAAVEGELTGRDAGDDGGGGAEPRDEHGEPIEAGGIQRHLRAARNLACGLAELEVGLQARAGGFPIVIDEVGAAEDVLDHADGRRAEVCVCLGEQAGEEPAF
jgi:hypothetical protein